MSHPLNDLVPSIDLNADPDDLVNLSIQLYANSHLRSDIRTVSYDINRQTVRNIISTYYDLQQLRSTINARVDVLRSTDQPHQLIAFCAQQVSALETGLIVPLDQYTRRCVPGRWALAQYGIGPVLAAGLVSYIDITKAPVAASVWRYAGLDPSVKYNKDKLPWNPELKNLSWKIGQSFMRFADRPDCFYGQLYLQDKQRRIDNNNDSLDPDQIDAQARRFAVKIFLSHYHAVAYQDHHGTPAPRPDTITRNGQSRYVPIPHNPFAETPS